MGELFQRFEWQTSDIHWAAYYLDPTNASPHFELTVQSCMTNFLKQYIGQYSKAEWAKIVQQFFDFQNHKHLFNSIINLWNPDLVNNPRLWWQYAHFGCYKLAILAIRIFSTPANSVLNKQAFSIINYLLNKFRAKSLVNSVDKSIYIYMNQRILRWVVNEFKVLSDLFEDEFADLEDEVIYLIKAGTNLVPIPCLPNIINMDYI